MEKKIEEIQSKNTKFHSGKNICCLWFKRERKSALFHTQIHFHHDEETNKNKLILSIHK